MDRRLWRIADEEQRHMIHSEEGLLYDLHTVPSRSLCKQLSAAHESLVTAEGNEHGRKPGQVGA